MIPKKWGQGQLFAFSALDGESFFTDDLAGFLCGDRIGVIFNTSCRRILYFGDMNKFFSPEINCTVSDMIIVDSLVGTSSMIFAERHLVVGEYADMSGVFVSLGGESEVYKKGETEIHNTNANTSAAVEELGALRIKKTEEYLAEMAQLGCGTDEIIKYINECQGGKQ